MHIISILLGYLLFVFISNPDAAIFLREANTFLRAIPEGLQQRQEAAIRQAINGDTKALDSVRKARDQVYPLPHGVRATDVSPRLRLYFPSATTERPLPLLVYLHGGGWTFGSINSCARFCSELVATGKLIVLAVNYRLAPEYPYPHGLNDCLEAVETAMEKASEWGSAPELVSVGGDSSGGNLAIASVVQRINSGSTPLRSLLLFYPVVSAWADELPSWQRYGEGAALDASLMEAFNRAYAPGMEYDPSVSVSLAAEEILAGFPPVLLVAAERDILCSQGEAFIRRLQRLGVKAYRRELPGTVHLFITVPGQEHAFSHAVALAEHFLCPQGTHLHRHERGQ